MKYLSLFSGGGGGDWAAQYYKALRPVAYVEFDPKPAAVLQARVNEGWLGKAPVHVMTVAEFTAQHAFEGMADVVTGGFPCQPFSVAGKQEAENDPRNAWPETAACLAKVRPAYAFLENVGGLASKPYFGVILSDLAQLGYDVQWRIVSAADVGATHERKRLWIAAFREGLPTPLQIDPPLARLVDGEWFLVPCPNHVVWRTTAVCRDVPPLGHCAGRVPVRHAKQSGRGHCGVVAHPQRGHA